VSAIAPLLGIISFPGWVPFPYLAIAKDTAGFIKAHDIALNNYDFDTLDCSIKFCKFLKVLVAPVNCLCEYTQVVLSMTKL
jgi:hypothetical protein